MRVAVYSVVGWLVLAPVAGAETLYDEGGWQVFRTQTNSGQDVCVVSTEGSGKYIGIKYYRGDGHLTIQMSNSGWTVRDQSQINVTMKFDDNSSWQAQASGFHMSDGDSALELTVGSGKVDAFMNEFKWAGHLYVGFPDNDVSDWTVALDGTNYATEYFVNCMTTLVNRNNFD